MIDSIKDYISQISESYKSVEYIKLVKTGKEAIVHLLKIDGNLVALKVYKENMKFSSREEYFNLSEIGDKRLIRAAKKKTRIGLGVIKRSWVNREFNTLEKLMEANALVPYPIMNLGNATVMDYFGDEDTPAPRLSDVRIPDDLVIPTLNIILDHIRLFLDLEFVHGDLSEYNILWFNNLPFIIDFPQVVYFKNRNYIKILNKDIGNIKRYFDSYNNEEVTRVLKQFTYEINKV